MSEEKYEGWTNRETWCLNLWLANDEGFYRQVREWALDEIENANNTPDSIFNLKDQAAYELAQRLEEFYGELKDAAFQRGEYEGCKPSDELVSMVDDVGSDYRVDWTEIALSWVEDELGEGTYTQDDQGNWLRVS